MERDCMATQTPSGIQMGETRFYKGIYPVHVECALQDEVQVKATGQFLDTSNYSDEKRVIKPGECFKAPGFLLWPHRRKLRKL